MRSSIPFKKYRLQIQSHISGFDQVCLAEYLREEQGDHSRKHEVEQNDFDDDEDKPRITGAAIPLGSIFSNMFSQKNENAEKKSNDKNQTRNDKKKETKQNKKKKYLDTYGTNLTNKAKNIF